MNEEGFRDEKRGHFKFDDKDEDDFSMSSYDGDQGDSLDIKPPQAIVARREKREKRDKRDRHRRKGERHKRERERDGLREHRAILSGSNALKISPEKRREHRRHRNMERSERKEARRHKERSGKYDRNQLYHKMEKERKSDRRRDKSKEYGGEHSSHHFRSYSGSEKPDQFDLLPSMPLHYHDKRMDDDQDSSGEHSERDKRIAKFIAADKQKELSQREADARRQNREEERRKELRYQQRMEAKERYRREEHAMSNKRKTAHYPEDLDIQIVSDDEPQHHTGKSSEFRERDNLLEAAKQFEKNKRTKFEENSSNPTQNNEESEKEEESSDSSDSSDSDSESDSSSSSATDSEQGKESPKEPKEEEPAIINRKKDSSTDTDTPVKDRRSDIDERTEFDDEIGDSSSESSVELKEQLPSYYPAIMGCRSVDEFVCLNRIEEGTFGVVYRAREKSNNDIVALKRLKMEKEKEGFPITSLREVNTLLKGQHQNIVTVREIVVGSNMDKIYIVMDYVEHDLKSLMETMKRKKQSFTIGETKTLMIQLLRAVHHLHDNWILHRDLKTSNLLLSHRGILKVGDFGLAREYGSPLKSYTPIVVTLWYRAPELLLGVKEYSTAIDVWSVGCIFGELLGMEAMFPGKSDIDQLNKIFKDLGTPSDKIWPGYSQLPVVRKTQFAEYPYNHLRERYTNRLSDEGFKLLNKFLTYNPAVRVKAIEALDHKYFHDELPSPVDPAMFPTWPAKSENPHDKTKKSGNSPKPPSGGKNFKDLGDGEDENIAAGHGFFLGEAVQPGAGFMLKF